MVASAAGRVHDDFIQVSRTVCAWHIVGSQEIYIFLMMNE